MTEVPAPAFSICIPTYNRSGLLAGVFENLGALRGPAFELVLVNDGSPDDTVAVIERLSAEASFPVRAVHIPHGGLGPALNAAFDHAAGEFIIIMDDDDLIRPDCLEVALDAWQAIPANQRDQYWGICGLCEYEDGILVGKRFPDDLLDTDYFTMRMVRNVRGDKKEVLRRSALGDFRFEVIEPERRAIKNMLWFGLARTYRTRFVNTVFMCKGRRPDGITANGRRQKVDSPNLTAKYNLSLLQWFPQAPLWLRFRFAVDFLRYRRHAGEPIESARNQLPAWLALAAAPFARLAVRRDLKRLGRPTA
ncbi:glycosyltransferase family 2 protein [Devosia sp. CN2-171]|uniref:glycosyltransferase family 2 protein n=1 Tax=Devosia sp. CN2-171 TaxID=3400909 RepID=UPI003BF78E3D